MKTYYWITLLAVAGVVWGQPPDTVWTYTFSTPFDDDALTITSVGDGGYLIAGFRHAADTGSVALAIKLDDFGHEEWAKTYTTFIRANSVIETSDGAFAMTGYCGVADVSAIKTNDIGEIQWSQCIPYSEPQEGNRIIETNDGGFAILTDGNATSDPDIKLLRLNAEGDSLWSRSYGLSQIDYGGGICATSDGGFVFCGSISLQACVIKTDSTGAVEWWTSFGADDRWEWPQDIIMRSDGSFVIAGFQQRASWQWNPYVACLSPNGDTLWTRVYPDLGPASPYCSILELNNGNLAVGTSFDGDYFVILLDEVGSLLSTFVYGTSSTIDILYDMCITADGGLVLAGIKHTLATNSGDIWVLQTESVLNASQYSNNEATDFTLLQNYPNPFNSTTTLSFSLSHTSPVSLTVFNLLGQAVYQADLGRLNAGEHRHLFDARDLPSGVYLVRVQVGDLSQMRKMVLLK